MGSLFDGIGGFPLAAVRNGIRPVWASEIEAFPMMDGGYMSPQCWKGEILKEVEYTDDLSLLEPRISDTNGNRISINLGALGKHKNSYWKFQREWRYIMVFMPMNFKTV